MFATLVINIVIDDPGRSELTLYSRRALQTNHWKEHRQTYTNIMHKIGSPSEDVHKGKIIRNPLIGKMSHTGGRDMGPELRRQFGKSLRTFFTRASLKQIKQRFFLPAGSGRAKFQPLSCPQEQRISLPTHHGPSAHASPKKCKVPSIRETRFASRI